MQFIVRLVGWSDQATELGLIDRIDKANEQ